MARQLRRNAAHWLSVMLLVAASFSPVLCRSLLDESIAADAVTSSQITSVPRLMGTSETTGLLDVVNRRGLAECNGDEDNVDFHGHDIGGGCETRFENTAGCCLLCASTPGCTSWTWLKPNEPNCPRSCWLKNSDAGRFAQSLAVSGYVYFSGQPAPKIPPAVTDIPVAGLSGSAPSQNANPGGLPSVCTSYANPGLAFGVDVTETVDDMYTSVGLDADPIVPPSERFKLIFIMPDYEVAVLQSPQSTTEWGPYDSTIERTWDMNRYTMIEFQAVPSGTGPNGIVLYNLLSNDNGKTGSHSSPEQSVVPGLENVAFARFHINPDDANIHNKRYHERPGAVVIFAPCRGTIYVSTRGEVRINMLQASLGHVTTEPVMGGLYYPSFLHNFNI